MSYQIYRAKTASGLSFLFSADLDYASSPIYDVEEDGPVAGETSLTPYRTGDANNNLSEVAQLLSGYILGEYEAANYPIASVVRIRACDDGRR